MTADDLSAPLGQSKPGKRRISVPPAVPQAMAGVLGLCLLVFVGWTLVVDNPFGGEPTAIVPTAIQASPQPENRAPPSAPVVQLRPETGEAAKDNASEHRETVTIIDGMSGKRQEVPIGQGVGPMPSKAGDGAVKTKAESSVPARQANIDARLLEETRHGPIPKIGPDGIRAADIYAHPVGAVPGRDGVRIALIVSGLGISASATTDALAKLAGPVTLAFSPYATDAGRWVDRARSEGHDVLMQVPMEPLDYPDNDPGPQTLLTTIAPEQNIDRLHWFMSRFEGYVGVINSMGARFTANELAAAPVLTDVARRGLIYVDDGSTPRSLAGQLSGVRNGAFAKADVVLDAVPTGGEIDNALGRLEALARDRGVAVGIVGALPIAIERLSQWTKAAEGRGLVLVPVSAVASKPKSS